MIVLTPAATISRRRPTRTAHTKSGAPAAPATIRGITDIMQSTTPMASPLANVPSYARLFSLTIPVTPYSVSKYSFSKLSNLLSLRPKVINMYTASATIPNRNMHPTAPAAPSDIPVFLLSARAPSTIRITGLRIQRAVAFATTGAPFAFISRNSFASSMDTLRTGSAVSFP